MKKKLLGVSAVTLSLIPAIGVVSCSNDPVTTKKSQTIPVKFQNSVTKDGSVEAIYVKSAINCGRNLDVKKKELAKYYDIPNLGNDLSIENIEAFVDSTQEKNIKINIFIKDKSKKIPKMMEFIISGFKEMEGSIIKMDVHPKPAIWINQFNSLLNEYKTNQNKNVQINILNQVFSGINIDNLNSMIIDTMNNKFTLKAKSGFTFRTLKSSSLNTITSENPKWSRGELTRDIVEENLETIWKNKTILQASDLEGYTSIGEYAFYKITEFTRIEIPDSVIVIKKGAFESTRLNGGVVIPNSVVVIEKYAFSNSNLYELELPASLVDIGELAFGYNRLRKLVIPNSVINIGDSAFFQNDLEDVQFGISVNNIGHHAFNGNRFIIRPKLPNKIITRDVFEISLTK